MFQPVRYIEVGGAFDFISANTVFAFKFPKPSVDQLRSVVVVWIKKAREHSRGPASPPIIVENRPKLNEQQASIPREAADSFRLRKLRFDAADASHGYIVAVKSRTCPTHWATSR
jgi:hypothetical protein